MLTLFLALAAWSEMGRVHAHEGDSQGRDLHFIGLSSGAAVPVLVAAGLYYRFFKDWDERRTRVEESSQQPALRPVEGD